MIANWRKPNGSKLRWQNRSQCSVTFACDTKARFNITASGAETLSVSTALWLHMTWQHSRFLKAKCFHFLVSYRYPRATLHFSKSNHRVLMLIELYVTQFDAAAESNVKEDFFSRFAFCYFNHSVLSLIWLRKQPFIQKCTCLDISCIYLHYWNSVLCRLAFGKCNNRVRVVTSFSRGLTNSKNWSRVILTFCNSTQASNSQLTTKTGSAMGSSKIRNITCL